MFFCQTHSSLSYYTHHFSSFVFPLPPLCHVFASGNHFCKARSNGWGQWWQMSVRDGTAQNVTVCAHLLKRTTEQASYWWLFEELCVKLVSISWVVMWASVWSQQVHKSVGWLWLTGTMFVRLPVVIGFILSHQGTQSLSRRMLSLYWELLDSKLLRWLVLFFFSFFCHGYWLSPAEACMCLLCSSVVFFCLHFEAGS